MEPIWAPKMTMTIAVSAWRTVLEMTFRIGMTKAKTKTITKTMTMTMMALTH